MKKHIDLDLDVYNVCESVQHCEEESIFYFRSEGKNLVTGFSGHDTNLATGFLTCLRNYPELYDIMDTALAVYDEQNEVN